MAPSIADTASEYTAREGSSVRLVCQADGRPKPDVVWTTNGQPLLRDSVLHDDGSLELLSVDEDDTATYTCTATSVAGVTEKRIRLTVHGQLLTQIR